MSLSQENYGIFTARINTLCQAKIKVIKTRKNMNFKVIFRLKFGILLTFIKTRKFFRFTKEMRHFTLAPFEGEPLVITNNDPKTMYFKILPFLMNVLVVNIAEK